MLRAIAALLSSGWPIAGVAQMVAPIDEARADNNAAAFGRPRHDRGFGSSPASSEPSRHAIDAPCGTRG
jgi:hypothetical protein